MTAAEQLAVEVVRRGAGPEVPVAVCLERSIPAAAAILGVLRAGAAFLPLDPAWPAERLRQILDDAGAPIVIAAAELAPQLRSGGRVVITGPGPAAREAREWPAPLPDSLAYVIYTSGSTGAPKGVEITHANLASLVRWHHAAFGVTGGDRAAWVAGLGFDASVWELLPNLAAGATICIPDEATRVSADALKGWLAREGVSVAFAPTPLAEALMRAEWPAETRLRLLLTGGDALHVRPRPGLPFQVVNNYGPTECTVVATSGAVAADVAASRLPSLGAPIGGRIEIVGTDGQRAGADEAGEIWIAGPHVGRGYRGRPDLTAERFVTAAPGGGPPERFYRTGDLGTWTEAGEIAFHGRIDDQIQQRGHRVEPDEIGAALARHPAVAQCAVAADGAGTEQRLVAYVVAAGSHIPRAGELRAFLGQSLPHYMLPDAFVRLPELPLTANGKVDRAALPKPTPANALPSADYRAPATPVEMRIAELVETLLEIEGVGLDDNFFLLGGHSLLGTQLVLRIGDLFGAELALRDLFEAQSIQNLAARVEQAVEAMVAAMSEDELAERLADASGP